MIEFPFNGKVHLVAGDLAHLIKLYGDHIVRDALDAHDMSPSDYHQPTLRDFCQQVEDAMY